MSSVMWFCLGFIAGDTVMLLVSIGLNRRERVGNDHTR